MLGLVLSMELFIGSQVRRDIKYPSAQSNHKDNEQNPKQIKNQRKQKPQPAKLTSSPPATQTPTPQTLSPSVSILLFISANFKIASARLTFTSSPLITPLLNIVNSVSFFFSPSRKAFILRLRDWKCVAMASFSSRSWALREECVEVLVWRRALRWEIVSCFIIEILEDRSVISPLRKELLR